MDAPQAKLGSGICNTLVSSPSPERQDSDQEVQMLLHGELDRFDDTTVSLSKGFGGDGLNSKGRQQELH
ncbi:hypothetical protein CesoFtcFv8_014076 [Champsocephalus esox]|uniref:Uncharacterized protein n=1 Tax=Champsocephalus esox TaxID=159716 RepID=A0AAN8BW81_9TELE|nr:hypothetical protein CesoFtcFv8_014076 [Champsocephalus esox]